MFTSHEKEPVLCNPPHHGPVAYPNCRDLESLANYCHSVEPLFPHLVEGDDKLCFKGLL